MPDTPARHVRRLPPPGKDNPFVGLPRVVYEEHWPWMTELEKDLYLALLYFAQGKGECFPSQKTLAQRTGHSVSGIKKGIPALRKRGPLDVLLRTQGPHGRATSVYLLLDPGRYPDGYLPPPPTGTYQVPTRVPGRYPGGSPELDPEKEKKGRNFYPSV